MEEKETRKPKKGLYRTLTVVGYVLIILFLLIIAPVVCPPAFGYHTYLAGNDGTGLVSKGSVVYIKYMDTSSIEPGKIVAVSDEKKRTVSTYYVTTNDVSSSKLVLEKANTADYREIKGTVRAKTPFMGYISGLCFHVWGIVLSIIIFVVGLLCTIFANKIAKKEKEQSRNRTNEMKAQEDDNVVEKEAFEEALQEEDEVEDICY